MVRPAIACSVASLSISLPVRGVKIYLMSTTTERVIVQAHGADDDAVRHGFSWLVKSARNLESAECAIYVSGLSNAQNLARPLKSLGSRLAADRSVNADGLTISLFTARNLRASYAGRPILAIWVDDDDIERIEELAPAAICAIPWSRDDLEAWKAAWAPIDLRTGRPAGEPISISNRVVEAALKDLTNHVNLSTGLTHPDDKRAAVWTFRLLRQAGERYDPSRIRAWAVRHGWSMKYARELGELSEKILDGRRVQAGGRSPWRTDIVAIWRTSVSE